MKWTTINYKGNKQTWYSQDVIQKIIEKCDRYIKCKCQSQECHLGQIIVATDILQVIESED